jgi:DNA-binding winged helix-turn-helix (wHTH) protein/Flp pilus assembly protein TadD
MRYEFAGYRVDPDVGLSFASRPIHLAPKERRLLLALLEARGRTLSKDDLIRGVWAGADVSDASIFRSVYKLRLAMGRAGGPELVATVYGTGFRIAAPIEVVQTVRSSTVAAITRTAESAAVHALISARELYGRRAPGDLDAAARAVQHALHLDPEYAAAWAMLAEIRAMQVARCLVEPREAARLARVAVHHALLIDPDCAPALAIRGWLRATVDLDVADGLADMDRAVRSDPDYWGTFLLRAWVLQAAKRWDEAIDVVQRALALNPTSAVVNANPALYLALAGRVDEALPLAETLAARFPTIDNAMAITSWINALHGRHDEAIGYARRARDLSPHTPLYHVPLAYALANAGRAAQAREVLAAIETFPLPRPTAITAAVHLALADRARAIDELADAYERGMPQLTWTRDDPRLSALRGDAQVESMWADIAPPIEPRLGHELAPGR